MPPAALIIVVGAPPSCDRNWVSLRTIHACRAGQKILLTFRSPCYQWTPQAYSALPYMQINHKRDPVCTSPTGTHMRRLLGTNRHIGGEQPLWTCIWFAACQSEVHMGLIYFKQGPYWSQCMILDVRILWTREKSIHSSRNNRWAPETYRQWFKPALCQALLLVNKTWVLYQLMVLEVELTELPNRRSMVSDASLWVLMLVAIATEGGCMTIHLSPCFDFEFVWNEMPFEAVPQRV